MGLIEPRSFTSKNFTPSSSIAMLSGRELSLSSSKVIVPLLLSTPAVPKRPLRFAVLSRPLLLNDSRPDAVPMRLPFVPGRQELLKGRTPVPGRILTIGSLSEVFLYRF